MNEEKEGPAVLSATEIVRTAMWNEKNNEFVLTYGRKQIRIKVDNIQNCFFADIANIREEKQESETTLLFEAAHQIMQKIADQKKQPYSYEFISKVPVMIDWAKNNGNKIFHWEEQKEDSLIQAKQTIYVAKATIKPQEE